VVSHSYSTTNKVWQEDDHVSFALVIETDDLSSSKEAIGADDHGKRNTAMEQEMESLDRNKTWKLVDLPKDSKAIRKDNKKYNTRLIV